MYVEPTGSDCLGAILFSQSIDAEGAIVFENTCEMRLEGSSAKRLGSHYWSGRVDLARCRGSGTQDQIVRLW